MSIVVLIAICFCVSLVLRLFFDISVFFTTIMFFMCSCLFVIMVINPNVKIEKQTVTQQVEESVKVFKVDEHFKSGPYRSYEFPNDEHEIGEMKTELKQDDREVGLNIKIPTIKFGDLSE